MHKCLKIELIWDAKQVIIRVRNRQKLTLADITKFRNKDKDHSFFSSACFIVINFSGFRRKSLCLIDVVKFMYLTGLLATAFSPMILKIVSLHMY